MPTANYQLPSAIFDRKRVIMHHARAQKHFTTHDFLLREMSLRLVDRLADMKREFSQGLVLGELLAPFNCPHITRHNPLLREEESLPFAPASFDLVMACGSLHWVNDLVGTLIQIQKTLKPDGLFLAMLPGGQTLKELRASFEQAELEIKGGISPHISPFVDVRDAGNLLSRAGFALPVADSEMLTVEYDHPLKLMKELRAMGQSNALVSAAKHFSRREVMQRAIEYYQQHFLNDDGRITASFELVTLTGWKPHASQQQPAKRGSGKINLRDVLD